MLLNTSKSKKLKNKKNHLRPGFIGFYWVGFFGQVFNANPEYNACFNFCVKWE